MNIEWITYETRLATLIEEKRNKRSTDTMSHKYKHTPGPWRFNADSTGGTFSHDEPKETVPGQPQTKYVVCYGKLKTTDIESGSFDTEKVDWYDWDYDYRMNAICVFSVPPNAHDRRLMVAAPELLEALDCLTAVIGLTPIKGNLEALQEAYEQARAAIAKAQGEQP